MAARNKPQVRRTPGVPKTPVVSRPKAVSERTNIGGFYRSLSPSARARVFLSLTKKRGKK